MENYKVNIYAENKEKTIQSASLRQAAIEITGNSRIRLRDQNGDDFAYIVDSEKNFSPSCGGAIGEVERVQ